MQGNFLFPINLNLVSRHFCVMSNHVNFHFLSIIGLSSSTLEVSKCFFFFFLIFFMIIFAYAMEHISEQCGLRLCQQECALQLLQL